MRAAFRLSFRISAIGIENLPNGAFILASNHRSYLDPPVIASVLPRRVFFIAKEELFRGAFGKVLPHLGALPIRRGGADIKALQRALELLKGGCAIAIFPEGTRANKGFLEPKPGVGLLAIKSLAPVLPVCIKGTEAVLPRGSKFPVPKARIYVKIGKPMSFQGLEEPEVYKQVARDVMDAIVGLCNELD
ncbi:MAG: 1-acyl-sn-glycerol-3-phosphate acyltransferase [Aquificaceae bacterium]|nr:1-acyl-sn-glycerol-3-phosphate acyltransferase [Aquificaceae bacterium]MDW8236847.1 lysophospholipid acyltransferase family protein [Aquificaceae bacterium]